MFQIFAQSASRNGASSGTRGKDWTPSCARLSGVVPAIRRITMDIQTAVVAPTPNVITRRP